MDDDEIVILGGAVAAIVLVFWGGLMVSGATKPIGSKVVEAIDKSFGGKLTKPAAGGSIAAAVEPVLAASSGPDVLDAIAQSESGGNPAAYNAASGAAGLWQFIPSTWRAAAGATGGPARALDASTTQQRAAAEWYAGTLVGQWRRTYGDYPTGLELYAMWFLGNPRAANTLVNGNPNAPMTSLLGTAGTAQNPEIARTTAADWVRLARSRLGAAADSVARYGA